MLSPHQTAKFPCASQPPLNCYAQQLQVSAAKDLFLVHTLAQVRAGHGLFQAPAPLPSETLALVLAQETVLSSWHSNPPWLRALLPQQPSFP